MSNLLGVIERSSRLGKKTKQTYQGCVRSFVEYAGESLTPAAVEAWRDELAEDLEPNTVNKYLYALRYASRRLEALELGPDFARAVESMPDSGERGREYFRRRALSREDAGALLSTCTRGRPPDLRDRAALVVGLRTGLRRSELLQLSYGTIKNAQATVVTKGNEKHTVTLDEESLQALGDWSSWLTQGAGYSPRGALWRRLFLGARDVWEVRGALQREAWINDMMKSRAVLAGLDPTRVHPHILRHTFISWALEAGVPPQRVMLMTNHKSLATLSRYVSDLQAESDPIGSYLPRLL